MMNKNRLQIGILSTNSTLYSTRRLVESIEQAGHEAVLINHTKCFVIMEQGKPSVHYKSQLINHLDAIIPRIGASVTFYGTAVLRQFELQKVYTPVRSQAIIRSRDKLRCLQILSKEGLGIPKTAFAKFPKNEDVEELLEQVGNEPVIIKLLEGTQGLGVILADTKKSAKSVIEAFSNVKTNILVQEYIAESRGADLRAIVVGNEVVASIERKGKAGEFRSNIHRGGSAREVSLTDEEKQSAVKAAHCMGMSIAGVDMLRSQRGALIIEVNSSPGLEGIEKATGKDVAGEMIRYIEQKI